MSRIGVVGAGGWGRNHVRSLAAMGNLAAICDLDEAVCKQNRGLYPNLAVHSSVEAIADDASIDGCIVATPAVTHAAVAKRLLLAGKDLLVEKPLALSSRDAEELCELAEAERRILMVGHLLLFHPAVQRLKKLIDDGDLGDLLYVVSRRVNLGVVRTDENAWWSLAPHDISLASYLFGKAPTAVAASGGTFLQRETGIEDVVFATVRFGESQLAHHHVSWLDPHKIRELTVVGSKKMAVFDDTHADEKLRVFDKGVVPTEVIGYADGVRVRTGDVHSLAVRMQEPLRLEHDAFLEAMRTRSIPLASGRDGLAVVRALEAGNLSLARDGAEVLIPASRLR